MEYKRSLKIGVDNYTDNEVVLDIYGNANVSGVITATSFVGAVTIQPNSVGLGTDTFGDYVKSLSGTPNQINVSGATGEGSVPEISIASNPTILGNVTVSNDLQINNNLNVTGNITIGGTAAYIVSNEFRVKDADIVLGYTTSITGQDASTDITANHGGIAIASTEGNPLVELYNVSIGETNPTTYKKFMWFKANAFTGLNTDAWLSNYAIGIGSTQFPSGTRLAAGSIQFTERDISVIRNINSSGVITATTFSGTISNATYAVSAGYSTASNYSEIAGIATDATYATSSGIATYATTAGLSTYATTAGISTYSTLSGISTNVIGGISSVTQLYVSPGISTLQSVTANSIGINTQNATSKLFVVGDGYFTGVVTASNFYVGNDLVGSGQISGDNIVGTSLSISGISTFGNVRISSGVINASSGVVTYYGDGSNLTGVTAVATVDMLEIMLFA